MEFSERFAQYLVEIKKVHTEASKAYLFLNFVRDIFSGIDAKFSYQLFPYLEKYLKNKKGTISIKGRADALLGNLIIEFKDELTKGKLVLTLVVLGLILFAFMLLVTTNTITNISAVEANGVGVYWDSNCTDRVFSIDWGNLTPGSVKSIVVYIRNEVEEPIYLMISTTNWNPSEASDYMTLRWDYTGHRMNPGENLQITLTFSVTRHVEGISSFSFDILITGSDSLPGDTNGDGIVAMKDIGLCCKAYGSYPGHPGWDSRCDLNNDDKVDVQDIGIVCQHYGETCP